MKFAAFGDMHGNATALEAVLADIEAREDVEKMVCLGDAFQGGAQPREVLDILLGLDCPTVLGNSDHFVWTGDVAADSTEQVSEGHRVMREWTAEQLGPDGMDFISTFPQTVEIGLEGDRKWLCFHGAPDSFNTVIIPETPHEEVVGHLSSVDADVLSGGHTHLQSLRRFDEKIYFNPGSAGAAYNRYMEMENFYIYPHGQYAVLTSSEQQIEVEFVTVPFDWKKYVESAKSNGHPYAEGEARKYTPH